MMTHAYLDHITTMLGEIEAEGMMKRERMITSPQGGEITVGGRKVINLCANNYLGLADHPDLIAAARDAMDPKGFGMASVRFICGTQDIHRELSRNWQNFWARTTRFCLPRVLTPMAACLSRCSDLKTRLCRTA
tara:strand:- start:245 stop:646 length:402 start_codon:yes stop_codon:yes gene_type:complete